MHRLSTVRGAIPTRGHSGGGPREGSFIRPPLATRERERVQGRNAPVSVPGLDPVSVSACRERNAPVSVPGRLGGAARHARVASPPMEQVLIFLPVLLVSVVLHELAHGWVALKQGDDTALRAGRLTLNPVPHIDFIGSILVPMALVLMPGNLLFGWAKPVPVDPRNFRKYRRGDILVSLAGVGANLALVAVFIGLMVAALWLGRWAPAAGSVAEVVYRMGALGVILNLILIFFNLIPLPPLDGSHVLYHLLPRGVREPYRSAGRYGLLILMGLIFLAPGLLSALLWPAYALTDVAFAVVEWLA